MAHVPVSLCDDPDRECKQVATTDADGFFSFPWAPGRCGYAIVTSSTDGGHRQGSRLLRWNAADGTFSRIYMTPWSPAAPSSLVLEQPPVIDLGGGHLTKWSSCAEGKLLPAQSRVAPDGSVK